jgi:NodT family efflux transporter outer membrane factor (OMF) lipoprotein
MTMPSHQSAEEHFALKGHDFSRAANGPKYTRALAPEGRLEIEPALYQGTTLQAAEKPFALKGHDFSRAISAAESTWALAPEGCFSPISLYSPPFSAASLVVPHMQQRKRRALAPELLFSGLSRCLGLSLGFANSPTRDHREAVANLLSLAKNPGRVPLVSILRPGAPRTSTIPIFICLLALTLLTGCKPVGPNYNRPGYDAPPAYKETGATAVQPPPAPAGGAWQPANPSDGLLRGKWWEIYQDPQLNQLEERIAAGNPNLRQALETYLAARDQITVARAALFPTLSAGPSIARDRISQNGPNYAAGKPATYNDFTLAGQASWEPDFWGRIRRTVEAARSNAQASAADAANIDLSLHAELAADFFQLRGLDSETRLLAATIVDLQDQLDLTQRRLAGGIGTEADVAQARTQLETVRAQLIDVGVARAQYEHAIGTLANENLSAFSIPFSPLELTLPKVPLGVPSQLLERRPDIAAAERRAAAANAQIGIAISAFYPTITLNGTGGFESIHAGTWIQGPSALWSLGGQATELLFDAGQRHALTDAARHAYEAQAAAYKASVLAAFNDVEDQLSGLRILEQESNVEQKAVESAQHSYEISNQRYKGGVTGYLEVLTAEATLLQNQRTAVDLQTRQFVSSVGLVRALGGGWDASQLPK